MKHIIRLFVLIAALVLGSGQMWADNDRVKFVYVGVKHGTATASDADANRLVTITVTPEGDWRCKDGDLTAEQSVNSDQAEARRRNSGNRSLGKGVSVDVTCVKTNEFTIELPEDGSTNVTVYVKFRAKAALTVTANDKTINFGEEPPANNGVSYSDFEEGDDETKLEGDLSYAIGKTVGGDFSEYRAGDPVGDYQIIPSGITSDDYKITFVPGKLTVNQKATISVEWDDNEDLGDLRPELLTFQLLKANNPVSEPVTLNEGNGWTYTVNGLEGYDNGGNLIPYTWNLLSTPEELSNNYELGTAPQNTTETGATATFTYIRKTGSLSVNNVLVSDLAADADVEFTYTVKLTPANITGTYGDMEFTDGEVTVTLKGGEFATATGLLYGTTYTVTQTEVEGFTTSPDFTTTGTISASSTQAKFTNTRETGSLTVTNTVYPSSDGTPFEFTVTLKDAPINGTYGDMTFINGEAIFPLSNGQTATATGLPTTVEYTVTQDNQEGFATTKAGDTGTISTTASEAAFKNIKLTVANFDIDWHDGGNTSSRPELTTTLLSKIDGDESQQVQTITLNEENNWQATIRNLPMYNEDGLEIVYSWSEIANVFSGYLLTDYSTDTQDGSYTYTLKTSATVTISWDDADDQDGIRPTEMTATLSDGSEYNKTVTLNSTNSWTATVEDLPKYKVDDSEITYTWTQDGTQPEGYALTNTSKEDIVTTITNSHTPEVTQVKVSKVWDDNNNEEGFRTESVTVHLMKGEDVIQTAVLNANSDPDHNWTHTWSGLAKNDNGTAINYTVTEDPVDNYSTQITKADGSFTYTVTNSRTVEKTQVSVEAIWDDNGNKEGFRPESVTVKLLADGNEANSVTLNEANEWKYTFTGLNKYASGQEIDYTIEQTQLANYKAPVIAKTSTTEWKYSVTNSRDLEETEATVKVVWNDGNNQNRPTEVTATLSDNHTVTLNAENDWTATAEHLQKYSNGTGVVYTWTLGELPVGYELATSSTEGTTTTLTYNYYPAVTVTITGHNDETTYDGTEHTVSGYEVASSYSLYTTSDFTFSGTASASQTEAGIAYMDLAADQFTNENPKFDGKVTFVIAADGFQTITPAPVTVKADDKSKEWGTADDPTLTATVTGMVNNEDANTLITYTIDRAHGGTNTDNKENSGEYIITPTGDATQGNYAVTYETGKFTIKGKPTTIQDVEGHDVSSVENVYTITEDQNGVTLTLVSPDENTLPPTVNIPKAVEVDKVEIERIYVSGRAATVYLPFSISAMKVLGGTFNTFASVNTSDPNNWTVIYDEVTSGKIEANTPYIFMPDEAHGGKITIGNDSKVSVCTANQKTTKQDQWEFIGTYEGIKWTSNTSDPEWTQERENEIGKVYGFAAVDSHDAIIGQFVQVTSGAFIKPMRAYLKHTPSAARHKTLGVDTLPETMKVVIRNAYGHSTEIGTITLDYETGEWYSIDGRKLSGKPTKKGLYINNGNKVVIK